MAKSGKLVPLLAVTMVAGLVIVAKSRWGQSGNPPAASISRPRNGDARLSAGSSDDVPTPKVLQAKPISHGPQEASPLHPKPVDTARPRPRAISNQSPAHSVPDQDTTEVSVGAPSSVTAHEMDAGTKQPEDHVAAAVAEPETELPQQVPSKIVTGANDSFWSISERAYGSGVYYRALFRHNRTHVLRPDQLRPGITLDIPPLKTLKRLYPQDCPEVPQPDRR